MACKQDLDVFGPLLHRCMVLCTAPPVDRIDCWVVDTLVLLPRLEELGRPWPWV